MAQVRITHQDGTVDEITTSGATQQIQVQQGDKIEVLNATLASATVDGNNYVVTLNDPSGTVEITFVDLFLLLATGAPTTAPAGETTSLFIGETEIASIGDALSQVATAAGPAGGGAVDGGLGAQARSGGSREAPQEFQAADLGTDEAPKGPLLQDFPTDEFPVDDPVTPDEEVPVNLPPSAYSFALDAEFFDGEGGGQQNATDGSAIKTTLSVTAGDQFTFDYSFLDREGTQGSESFGDFGFVVIGDTVIKLADVLSSPDGIVNTDLGSVEQTGPNQFTVTFAESGDLSFGFGVMNEGDTAVDSALLIDNITFGSGDGALLTSFEGGLPEGWTSIGNTSVVDGTFGITPTDGDEQALMVAEGATDAQIEAFFGLPAGSLDSAASGGGPDQGGFIVELDLGGSNDGISIGGTDPEDGLTTTYTITSLPSDGLLFADLDQNGSYETQLQVGDTLTADGDELANNVLYVAESRPDDGQDEFTYTTTDSQGAVSSPATITIDFPNPVVSIESVVESEFGSSDVVEGDVAVFRVFLEDGASTEDVTVDLSAADGSATGGEDYNNVIFYLDEALTIPVTSATITAGDSEVLVYVDTIDDTDVEGDENYDLNISNSTNATLGTTSAQGTIFDNDALTLTLSGDASVTEGALGAPDFAVTLSNGTIPTGETLTADLTITLPGGTDALAADFIETFLQDLQDAAEQGVTVGSATVNGSDITVELTFDSTWDGTFDYELPTFDDLLIEGPEDFSQTLSNGVISNGGSATATGTVVTTIIDNDALAGDGSGTVDEAALDTIQGGDDLAPGTVEGSNPSSTTETATGSVTLDFGGGPVTDVTNISLAAVTDPDDGDAAVALTSGGDPVSTQYIDATNTLIGYVNVGGTADFDGDDVQVFEMTLDTDGNFVFTLTGPIDQPDADETGAADPLALALSYTATDGVNTDGGTITITVNDDGPSITATGAGPNLTVDETTLGTDDVGSFAGSFNGVPGADGEASTTYALSVDGGDGSDSGLVDTATGESILLYSNGGVIEGRTSGTDDLVFTLTVDGSGDVELDQLRAIEHDPDTGPDQSVSLASGLLSLTATITDNDGDTDTATLDIGDNLSFEDDAPSITATGAGPNLTVDETTLGTDDVGSFAGSFNGVPGADGEASTTYALSVDGGDGFDSGLVDTATGESILLYSNGGVIEGRTSGTDDLVFTLTVDGSGDVELDQLRAIEHDPDTGPDQSVSLASGLLTLTATITDNDGDTDTATLDIGDNLSFEDDAPIGGTAQTLVLTNSLSNSGTADLNFVSFGADGDGGHLLTMAMASDGTQTSLLAGAGVYGDTGGGVTQLTSNGTDLVWEDNLDGSWSAVTDDANADVVFTVDVNADGTYTVTMDAANPLDGAFTSFTLDFTQGVTGGNNEQLVFFDSAEPDVAPADGIPDGSTIMALAVGTDSDGTTGTVNSSTQGMGVSQGNTIDVNGGVSEELSLFFADPQDPSTVAGPGSLTLRQQSFATIRLDSLNGGEFAIIVVHIADTGEDIYFKVQGFGNGASTDEFVTITQGTDGDGSLSGDGMSAATAFEVDMSVDGFGTLFVDGTFDHLHFEADVATDSSYRLVSASGTEETSGFDVDTSFTATSTDGDGDTVDTGFDVTLDSGTEMNGTAGDDVLIGNGGQTIDQVINGLGGNDIIDGGAGADTIDGGAGEDIFVYNAGSNVGVDIDEILAFAPDDDSFLFDDLGVTDAAIIDVGGNDALQINGTVTVADLGTTFGTLQVDAVDINGTEATVTLSLV